MDGAHLPPKLCQTTYPLKYFDPTCGCFRRTGDRWNRASFPGHGQSSRSQIKEPVGLVWRNSTPWLSVSRHIRSGLRALPSDGQTFHAVILLCLNWQFCSASATGFSLSLMYFMIESPARVALACFFAPNKICVCMCAYIHTHTYTHALKSNL